MASATKTRHWISGTFLTIALLMVICGTTFLSAKLKEVRFLVYWLVCFGFTGLAALTAMIEIFIIRRQSRELEKKLIKDTLDPLRDKGKI